MSELGEAIGMVSPYYNLVFVAIAVVLFLKLFKTSGENQKVFIRPWKIIFAAVAVFIIEEVFTVLRALEVFGLHRSLNGFFEIGIIILFIYSLLVQKEYVTKMIDNMPRPVSATTTQNIRSPRQEVKMPDIKIPEIKLPEIKIPTIKSTTPKK